ncbi:hypothetical protein KAR91_63400 [Candidatus Pacearchaeota archaeon]|nr:hypothetical protein [Candidatus Pacearchaeota archaeon]
MDEQAGGHTHTFKEKELIETIKKVSLEKDDILIFQINDDVTMEQQHSMLNYLEHSLPNIKCLVIPKSLDINVINVKDINKVNIK